jgi:hypothetical protein
MDLFQVLKLRRDNASKSEDETADIRVRRRKSKGRNL